MPEAVFDAGDGVMPLVFSVNPVYPCKVVLYPGSVRVPTEGGDEYVYRKGGKYALHFLRFEGLPASDFDGGYDYAARAQAQDTQSLVNWFLNVVGLGQGFTYRDPFDKEHSVTIADNSIEFSMGDYGLYDGVITLRERLD